MLDIFQRLHVAGDEMDEDQKVLHILSSIPDHYHHLVDDLPRGPKVPKMDMVLKHLLGDDGEQISRNYVECDRVDNSNVHGRRFNSVPTNLHHSAANPTSQRDSDLVLPVQARRQHERPSQLNQQQEDGGIFRRGSDRRMSDRRGSLDGQLSLTEPNEEKPRRGSASSLFNQLAQQLNTLGGPRRKSIEASDVKDDDEDEDSIGTLVLQV